MMAEAAGEVLKDNEDVISTVTVCSLSYPAGMRCILTGKKQSWGEPRGRQRGRRWGVGGIFFNGCKFHGCGESYPGMITPSPGVTSHLLSCLEVHVLMLWIASHASVVL